MTGLDNERSPLVGPAKRLRRLIVVLNEGQDPLTQRLQRRKTRSFQCAPHQEAEPHLDLVEPRVLATCRIRPSQLDGQSSQYKGSSY